MKKIIVVGGGFSGVVCAHQALKRGYQVELHEKSNRLGGMIKTESTEYGAIESAANGFVNSPALEELFDDIGLDMEVPKRESRMRYIFIHQPRRWPLGFKDTLLFAGFVFRFLFRRSTLTPRANETVAEWGTRCVSAGTVERLISPALQGIYGATAEELSAELIWNSLVRRPPSKQRPMKARGTVRPRGGMEQFFIKWQDWAKTQAVKIYFNSDYALPTTLQAPVFICTSASGAAQLVQSKFPDLSRTLAQVPVRPLVTVTVSWPKEEEHIKGFGVLFAREQGVKALGVLFDHQIFDNRISRLGVQEHHIERWIYDGRDLLSRGEIEIEQAMMADRHRLYGRITSPISCRIERWPTGLPLYNLHLNQLLKTMELPPNLFLGGNYLGSIGLTKILDRINRTFDQMSEGVSS